MKSSVSVSFNIFILSMTRGESSHEKYGCAKQSYKKNLQTIEQF